MNRLLQSIFFKWRFHYINKIFRTGRNLKYRMMGMDIGSHTYLPKMVCTWPHKISLGDKCLLEHDIIFKHDGIWSSGRSIIIGNNVFIGNHCEFNVRKKVSIGNDCLIASGCKFIDHDHGMKLDELMRKQKSIDAEIIIEDNVWLGTNVVVLKGVHIGNDAVVAAGAIVTKSVPTNEIWGGVPAKKIGERK